MLEYILSNCIISLRPKKCKSEASWLKPFIWWWSLLRVDTKSFPCQATPNYWIFLKNVDHFNCNLFSFKPPNWIAIDQIDPILGNDPSMLGPPEEKLKILKSGPHMHSFYVFIFYFWKVSCLSMIVWGTDSLE